MAEPSRRDFWLYVDEFQNFATESFATILSAGGRAAANASYRSVGITRFRWALESCCDNIKLTHY